MGRRYAEIRIRMIVGGWDIQAMEAAARIAVNRIEWMDTGEVDIRVKMGPEIKINEHGYAVPWPKEGIE